MRNECFLLGPLAHRYTHITFTQTSEKFPKESSTRVAKLTRLINEPLPPFLLIVDLNFHLTAVLAPFALIHTNTSNHFLFRLNTNYNGQNKTVKDLRKIR